MLKKSIKIFKVHSVYLVLFAMVSCNKSDCLNCIHQIYMENEVEICDDSEITYTDVGGNVIPFEELDEFFEELGFDCIYK